MHRFPSSRQLLAGCLPAVLAAAQTPIQVGVAEYERASSAAFFYSQTAAGLDVFGQFELTYGRPVWKDEHASVVEDAAPGTRLRLGNNFFSTFDTSCAVHVGEKLLEPGLYYLALERGEPGEMSLVFLDPTPIRQRKQNGNHSHATTGGVALPLEWNDTDDAADRLTIGFTPIRTAGTTVQLALRFGNYEMTATLRPEIGATKVECSTVEYERASSATFFYSQAASGMEVFGQFELTYGSPIWKDEHAAAVEDEEPGDRLRLGNNFFSSLDTSCPVQLGDATLPPGSYYLALQRGGAGEMSLLFLDAALIRERKQNGNHSAVTTGGIPVPLDWNESDVLAKRLRIRFEPARGGEPAAWLDLRFGHYAMKALLRPLFERRD